MAANQAVVMEFSRQLDVQRIEQLQREVETLRDENKRMTVASEKSGRDQHEFVRYWKREMDKKNDQIEGLKEELIRTQMEYKEQQEAATQSWEGRLKELQEQTSATEHGLRQRLQIAEEEFAKLQGFREEKTEMLEKITAQEAEIARMQKAHTDDMASLEIKFLEGKARMQQEREAQIEGIRKQARDDARRGLDADTKKIIGDNKRMGEELRFQLHASDELQREKDELQAERGRLRLEVQLLQDKERVFAEEGHVHVQRIKHLEGKVKNLERSLSQVVKRFEHETASRSKQANKQLEEQQLDTHTLRKMLKAKNQELRQMRAWSQTILAQRGDVEKFFLEALAAVKEDIRKARAEKHTRAVLEYKAQLRQASKSQGAFPQIRAASSRKTEDFPGLDEAPTPPPTNVDLADLAPEDRERVLRLLFAKINSVQAALEPAPQHTLDEGQLEAIGADVAGAASTLARDNGAGVGTMSTQMIDGSGMFASQ